MDTVLIAIDFSACADGVARRGGELARELGATPRLVHVVPPPDVAPDARIPVGGSGAEPTVAEYLRHASEDRMARYAALAGDDATTIVRFGEPAETIVDEARRSKARMIVVGTRARHGLARVVHGSVAEEVVRHADVPVTTIRSHWSPECKARSCNWCVRDALPEEERVADEQYG